ncbi:MAG TPA: hypothetical protein DHW82_03985 [Spirochaetia bacterium]|nr:MAG: hypothetical protein A2Y41_01715 [Spirochaetes bacterium GWB1_36_13]HCL56153.1 hypothetical protein [Spirochaetia bacterium]
MEITAQTQSVFYLLEQYIARYKNGSAEGMMTQILKDNKAFIESILRGRNSVQSSSMILISQAHLFDRNV